MPIRNGKLYLFITNSEVNNYNARKKNFYKLDKNHKNLKNNQNV